MLKELRRKFIAIVMVLVGSVMIAVLGSSYLTAWDMQEHQISDALERSLRTNGEERPIIGARRRVDGEMGFFGGMLGITVELDELGSVVYSEESEAEVDEEALALVVDQVFNQGVLEGHDRLLHVGWLAQADSTEETTGSLRVAIVDTSTADTMMREQAIRDLWIVALALLALFGISWWLSGWALAPVERAWQQQRRFVADASHELKTPLAVILANTQILAQDESLGDDARAWVQSTSDEASHMKALVQDLLQLARADESASGESATAMHKEEVDLSEIVERSALEFDVVAFERGCSLECDIEEGLHLVGDAEWMERLVRILIDNACKYAATDTEVDIRLARTQGHTQLSVHNWGNPIDPEDLPHVFERFYRSDKVRTRDGEGGFGLGLAIAKGIADAHGGKLTASSSEEAGTSFVLSI